MRADEVRKLLKIGRNTLYQWCEQGIIPHKRVGRVILFPKKRIWEWLDNNEKREDEMRGHIAMKNGRYYPVISMKDPATGKWKRKWLSGYKSKREAEKARAEAVARANNGWLTIPSRETVDELCQAYLTTTAPLRVRPVTLQSYRQMLNNHLIPKLGAKRAAALTADDLNRVMANVVKTGRSVTTARYLHRVVHRVLDDAVKKGKLTRNVADLADPPPARPYEGKTWSEADLDLFLTAVASSEYAGYFTLLATTALTGVVGVKLWEYDGET